MSGLWKWIDERKISESDKIGIFLHLNSLLCGFIGFAVWLIVSRFAFSTWNWAICFVGYPGFFVGFIGGFIFLCQQ